MIRRLPQPVGVLVEHGSVEVDAALAARYAEAVGAAPSLSAGGELPLGLALSVRGGALSAMELDPQAIGVHGGHTVTLSDRFVYPAIYRLAARIDQVFEKSGRSGPLTVIARSSLLSDPAGRLVAMVADQHIVRWRAAAPGEVRPAAIPLERPPTPDSEIEVGAMIAVEHGPAPDASGVHRYAQGMAEPESLFVDPAFARQLGFADVIVPGPLQAALMERLIATRLPEWRLERISLSFRISVIAAELITLSAQVIEAEPHDPGMPLVLDLTIENARGERAAVGTATLRRRA